MKTIVKKFNDLTDEEYRWCYNANLCAQNYEGCGNMRPMIRGYKENPLFVEYDNPRIVMLIDERFTNARRLVGWSLVFGKDNAYFWTKPHMRNKGYGTLLMQGVKKISPKPRVYPHTNESGGFFSKFDVDPVYGKNYLVNKPKVC